MNYVIQDKEQFKQYRDTFRALSTAKEATAEDHILYNLIRGKDLKYGFTPITSERKLNADYYRREWRAFETALESLKNSIKNRQRHKEWFAKYGGPVPTCLKYSEVIAEEQWDSILEALGGAK